MLVSLYKKLFKKTVITNENQTDLSLGYTHISFDASVMPNGHIGIGMYDITNKVKKHSGGKVGGFSSAKGEMAALMFTLDYATENKFNRLNLYTDNLDLATKNIKKILKNYNFIDVKLTWVPRELNTSADKLSKEGQKINKIVAPVFVGPSANQANKTEKKKVKKLVYGKDLIGPAEPPKIEGTFRLFHGWSYDKKVIFLSKLAKDDFNEQEFIRMLKAGGAKDNYKFNTSVENIMFLRMAKTLLIADASTSEYVKKRLRKLKDTRNNQRLQTLTFKSFSEEFNKRKPKNLLEKEAA